MDDDRHAGTAQRTAASRQIGGQGDVTAETDHDIGLNIVEHGARLPDRPAHPQRQPHQIAGEATRQRHRNDQFQVVTTIGNQPRLEAALGTQRGDPHRGINLAQRVGNRHGRLDVSRGAATGQHHRKRPKFITHSGSILSVWRRSHVSGYR
ncbi:putative beta-N-acetylglucosaminyltransferase [Mycobacteroides abscessus MAB_082312_2272]|nr:putative beta-N-acetylglucosaminyltransferase [Mycobacteroides abscessus MAB_082312_2272]